MLAQTVVCPSCRAELKLPPKLPPGLTAAKCPKCGGVVPLGPPAPAPPGPPTHPASDTDASVADRTRRVSPAAPAPGTYPFLAPPRAAGEIGWLAHYRVHSELGRGGMGVVFAAEDMNLRRPVALKVMLPQFAASPTDRARFLREARAQAAVDHDHVAAIFQVGEDRGTPFLAMPLLRGQSLADALRANPRVPLSEAVRIAREMAEGLAAAHERGLVHRDIKPGNIWLEGKGRRVKILDFGLARVAEGGADEPDVTQRGAVVGTPAYMSPEQARGEHLGARSDLFSLGTVLYQLLAGRQPFRGSSTTGVLIAVATETPPPPSEHNPEVPQAIDSIALALLEKDPARRPHSAEVVADALRAVEAALGAGGVPSGVVVIRPALPPPGAPADPWGDLDVTQTEAPELQPVTTHTARTARHAAPREPEPVRGRTKLYLALGVLMFVALVAALAVIVIRAEDRDGTLVIEISDTETEAKLRGGRLVVLGPDGTERYALSPTERTKVIDAGSYVLRAENAEGQALDLREFVLKKGEKATVRVNLTPRPKPNTSPRPDRVTPPDPEADRRAADYALSVGGSVRVNSESKALKTVAELPREPFRLTSVDLSDTKASDLGLENFRGCKHLTSLHLSRTQITDAGLANFKDCKELAQIGVRETSIGDAGLAHLKDCKRLTSIDLLKTRVTDTGAAYFKDCKDEITFLQLNGTQLTDAGLAHFAGGKSLTQLDISGTKVSTEGIGLFKDCKRLTTLWLNDTPLTDDALAPFGECKSLREMSLVRTKVTDAGMAAFKDCTTLTFLSVGGTKVGDAGLAHFAGCKGLQTLNAWSSAVTDAGAAQFAAFKGLTALDLYNTEVTDECVDPVCRLKGLTFLDVRKTQITADGFARLKKALPACKVSWNADTPERTAAEAVLLLGGTVRVNDEPTNIKLIANLPLEAFRLTSIDLPNAALKDTALAPLKGCKNLTTIGLSRSGVTDAGLEPLADCPDLVDLNLGDTKVTDTGLVLFAGRPKLKYLLLDNTRVTDAGMVHFAGCKKLVSLNLFKTGVTDEGVAHFAGCTELTRLVLGGTKVGDAGLAHFAASKKLTHLDVGTNGDRITDEGLAVVKNFPDLYRLHVAKTAVTDAGLAHLKGHAELTEFFAWGAQIGDAGLAHLKGCTKIAILGLGQTKVGDAGLAVVKDFPDLKTLYVDGTLITDAGLPHLADCKQLTDLDVRKTKVTEAGIDVLKAALPKCRIVWDGGTIEPKKE